MKKEETTQSNGGSAVNQIANTQEEKRAKYNEYHRNYYTANKERIRIERQAIRDTEKEVAQQKERYEGDEEYRERKIKNSEKWREANRDKYNEYMREYRKKRKDNN